MKSISQRFTPKSVAFFLFQVFMYMVLNASTIAAVVMLFIDVKVEAKDLDSKYEAFFPVSSPTWTINFFQYLKMKAGLPKEIGCIVLFSLFGLLLTFFYTKFLYKIIIRKLDIRKENISQEKELEIKRESLKIEKEKQELDILKIKAEAGLLTEKEIKRLEDRLC